MSAKKFDDDFLFDLLVKHNLVAKENDEWVAEPIDTSSKFIRDIIEKIKTEYNESNPEIKKTQYLVSKINAIIRSKTYKEKPKREYCNPEQLNLIKKQLDDYFSISNITEANNDREFMKNMYTDRMNKAKPKENELKEIGKHRTGYVKEMKRIDELKKLNSLEKKLHNRDIMGLKYSSKEDDDNEEEGEGEKDKKSDKKRSKIFKQLKKSIQPTENMEEIKEEEIAPLKSIYVRNVQGNTGSMIVNNYKKSAREILEEFENRINCKIKDKTALISLIREKRDAYINTLVGKEFAHLNTNDKLKMLYRVEKLRNPLAPSKNFIDYYAKSAYGRSCLNYHLNNIIKQYKYIVISPIIRNLKTASYLGNMVYIQAENKQAERQVYWYKPTPVYWKMHCELAHSDVKNCVIDHQNIFKEVKYGHIDNNNVLHEYSVDELNKECKQTAITDKSGIKSCMEYHKKAYFNEITVISPDNLDNSAGYVKEYIYTDDTLEKRKWYTPSDQYWIKYCDYLNSNNCDAEFFKDVKIGHLTKINGGYKLREYKNNVEIQEDCQEYRQMFNSDFDNIKKAAEKNMMLRLDELPSIVLSNLRSTIQNNLAVKISIPIKLDKPIQTTISNTDSKYYTALKNGQGGSAGEESKDTLETKGELESNISGYLFLFDYMVQNNIPIEVIVDYIAPLSKSNMDSLTRDIKRLYAIIKNSKNYATLPSKLQKVAAYYGIKESKGEIKEGKITNTDFEKYKSKTKVNISKSQFDKLLAFIADKKYDSGYDDIIREIEKLSIDNIYDFIPFKDVYEISGNEPEKKGKKKKPKKSNKIDVKEEYIKDTIANIHMDNIVTPDSNRYKLLTKYLYDYHKTIWIKNTIERLHQKYGYSDKDKTDTINKIFSIIHSNKEITLDKSNSAAIVLYLKSINPSPFNTTSDMKANQIKITELKELDYYTKMIKGVYPSIKIKELVIPKDKIKHKYPGSKSKEAKNSLSGIDNLIKFLYFGNEYQMTQPEKIKDVYNKLLKFVLNINNSESAIKESKDINERRINLRESFVFKLIKRIFPQVEENVLLTHMIDSDIHTTLFDIGEIELYQKITNIVRDNDSIDKVTRKVLSELKGSIITKEALEKQSLEELTKKYSNKDKKDKDALIKDIISAQDNDLQKLNMMIRESFDFMNNVGLTGIKGKDVYTDNDDKTSNKHIELIVNYFYFNQTNGFDPTIVLQDINRVRKYPMTDAEMLIINNMIRSSNKDKIKQVIKSMNIPGLTRTDFLKLKQVKNTGITQAEFTTILENMKNADFETFINISDVKDEAIEKYAVENLRSDEMNYESNKIQMINSVKSAISGLSKLSNIIYDIKNNVKLDFDAGTFNLLLNSVIINSDNPNNLNKEISDIVRVYIKSDALGKLDGTINSKLAMYDPKNKGYVFIYKYLLNNDQIPDEVYNNILEYTHRFLNVSRDMNVIRNQEYKNNMITEISKLVIDDNYILSDFVNILNLLEGRTRKRTRQILINIVKKDNPNGVISSSIIRTIDGFINEYINDDVETNYDRVMALYAGKSDEDQFKVYLQRDDISMYDQIIKYLSAYEHDYIAKEISGLYNKYTGKTMNMNDLKNRISKVLYIATEKQTIKAKAKIDYIRLAKRIEGKVYDPKEITGDYLYKIIDVLNTVPNITTDEEADNFVKISSLSSLSMIDPSIIAESMIYMIDALTPIGTKRIKIKKESVLYDLEKKHIQTSLGITNTDIKKYCPGNSTSETVYYINDGHTYCYSITDILTGKIKNVDPEFVKKIKESSKGFTKSVDSVKCQKCNASGSKSEMVKSLSGSKLVYFCSSECAGKYKYQGEKTD